MKASEILIREMKLERFQEYILEIRVDAVVGVDSLSVIDECWSDARLLQMLFERKVMSVKDAISVAREIHENYLDTDF